MFKRFSTCRFAKTSFLFCLTCSICCQIVTGSSPVFANEDVMEQLQEIGKQYELKIVSNDAELNVTTRFGKIKCTTAAPAAVKKYARLFIEEFKLYPPELVKKAKVKRVVLCTDLSFGGQRRNAIPDWHNDTLYLEVVRGAGNSTYMRRVVHHEFFHMVDYWDDKNVYKDSDWAALNPTDFKYGTGGKNAQNNRSTGVLTEKYPGFLNHYSTTGVEEDKAEVFAHLIIAPDYMKKRAKENSVLRAKVARMKNLLKDFCPEVDEQFWTNASKLERQ